MYNISIKTMFYIYIVDGGWSNWLVGNCSKLCGGGNKTKIRTCNNPAPSCGGNNCIGETVETVECNTNPCIGMWLCMYVCMYTYIMYLYIRHCSDTTHSHMFYL